MQYLIKVKEWRNSRQLIKFLGLNQHFPESIERVPNLVFQNRDKGVVMAIKAFYYVEKHRLLLVTGLNKKKRQSFIRLYNFKVISAIDDSFIIKAK